MNVVAVVGAQWGDEGKGKIVDYLAGRVDVVARYAGGPNAGHTLVVDGNKIIVRLIPSGVLHKDKTCILGPGMVIDPKLFVNEIDDFEKKGYSLNDRLFVSYRAHLILAHHIIADGLREQSLSKGKAIGTTRRGIGPAYEDKAARRGLPIVVLRDLDRAAELVESALQSWAPFFQFHSHPLPRTQDIIEELKPLAERIVPMLADTSQLIIDRMKLGQSILLEGAQGTLLDIDHGTYPFVTSSSSTAGGACTGSGIGPRAISSIIGAAKAYVTRVGGGPFPTELKDEAGEHMCKVGAEFGSVTGRPRRAGWLDLPALRYAVQINSLDSLVLTKLDVLTGIKTLRVCIGYDTPDGRTSTFPTSRFDHLDNIKPIYEDLDGWQDPIEDVCRFDRLPKEAQYYVNYIENFCNVPCNIISVGPGRDAMIVRRDPFSKF